CFFFFSSRRRHTSFSRDWSSDVCSSDLQTLDLENFSGRSVRAVKQDFYAAQFLKNLAQLLLRSQQAAIDRRHRNHKHRWKANFTQGVSRDRKSTRLNSSHVKISYAVFCLKKKK